MTKNNKKIWISSGAIIAICLIIGLVIALYIQNNNIKKLGVIIADCSRAVGKANQQIMSSNNDALYIQDNVWWMDYFDLRAAVDELPIRKEVENLCY